MYLLREPGESEFRVMGGAHHPVPVKSEVIVRTGGGGGWGDPLERDPAAVRADVQEEFVSRDVGARGLRRGAARRFEHRPGRDRGGKTCHKIGTRERATRGEGMSWSVAARLT